MSEYYFISGKVEIYDIEKFKDWLFEELQKQEFVGIFDININEETENVTCKKAMSECVCCGATVLEGRQICLMCEKNLKLLKELRKEGEKNGMGSRGVQQSDTKLQSVAGETTSQR
jgi:hypothetical protein